MFSVYVGSTVKTFQLSCLKVGSVNNHEIVILVPGVAPGNGELIQHFKDFVAFKSSVSVVYCLAVCWWKSASVQFDNTGILSS